MDASLVEPPVLCSILLALFTILLLILKWTVFYKTKSLSGLICLITGGAGEIGELMTVRLIERGVKVVVWDNNRQRIDAMRERLQSDLVHYYEVDVSLWDAVEKSGDMLLTDFGNLDILINNAVLANPYDIEESTHEELSQAMNVNLMSHLWTIKKFLPSLRSSRKHNGLSGTIVGMSSVLGSVGTGGLQTYCTSKAGIIGLMESLYMQHPDIHWCIVTPFLIDTALFRGMKHRFMNFVYPILQKEYVADKIVRAIERQQTYLSIPWAWNYIFTVVKNVLPLNIMKLVQDFFGVPNSFRLIHRRETRTKSPPS